MGREAKAPLSVTAPLTSHVEDDDNVGKFWGAVQSGNPSAQLTARSFAGYVGQKKWDSEVLTEMEKALGKPE